jgi:hypothetical protein
MDAAKARIVAEQKFVGIGRAAGLPYRKVVAAPHPECDHHVVGVGRRASFSARTHAATPK